MADAEIVVDNALGAWGSDPASFPPQVRAAYIEALRDRNTVHAIYEEYRAAATIDFAKDTEDLMGSPIVESCVRHLFFGAKVVVSTPGMKSCWAVGYMADWART
jgi:hypothetical protein